MHFDFVDPRLRTALGETANQARAASRCHLAAPAASNRLKNLNESMGFRILVRTSQGMTPTPAGECYMRHAWLLQEQVERLAADMQQFGEGFTGHVRIWTNSTAMSGSLPDVLGRFLRKYGNANSGRSFLFSC